MAIKTSKYLLVFMFVLLIAAFSQNIGDNKLPDPISRNEINIAKANSAVSLGLAKLRVDSIVQPVLRKDKVE